MEQGLNLIQQLQATSKWSEFQKWYKTIPELQYPYSIDSIKLACGNFYAFKNFPFMFQKGVFEKFIESRGCNVITWVGEYQIEYCLHAKDYVAGKDFSTFEELLIWYFNN